MGILESIESRWESGNLVQAVASSLVRWMSRYEKSKRIHQNTTNQSPTRNPNTTSTMCKQMETKCQETSVSELTKREVQLLVRTSVALLTKLGRFISAWILMPYPPRPTWVTLESASINEGKVPICSTDSEMMPISTWSAHVMLKSDIRSLTLLVEEGEWYIFISFCVNIFCFLYSFWYARMRAPFFYCLFAFVLIFYCFFCFLVILGSSMQWYSIRMDLMLIWICNG